MVKGQATKLRKAAATSKPSDKSVEEYCKETVLRKKLGHSLSLSIRGDREKFILIRFGERGAAVRSCNLFSFFVLL